MKGILEIVSLNVQVLQVAAFIWGVFEIKFLRHVFEEHMKVYHGEKRRKEDGQNSRSAV